jgi:CRP/FNR family cyclic AMP-dependent transcriptional regulator
MKMQTLEPILAAHPFFKDLAKPYLELLVGCASNVRFEAGEYILRQGQEANTCYIIRHGNVALEILTPGRGPITIETISEGDVLGWSWLFPPYKWHFDARAVELTRAIALDGVCLREKCEADHNLGFELLKRFAEIMTRRLQATRLQLLDVYHVRP